LVAGSAGVFAIAGGASSFVSGAVAAMLGESVLAGLTGDGGFAGDGDFVAAGSDFFSDSSFFAVSEIEMDTT
jgi:hypothetical protein